MILRTSEIRLFYDGAEDPGVRDNHDEERDEVDGDEEEEGEGRHCPGVGTERDALLHRGTLGRWTSIPHENLKHQDGMRMTLRGT